MPFRPSSLAWRICLLLVAILGVHCASGHTPSSLDLAGVRIGEHRSEVEAALTTPPSATPRGERTVVVYEYGPGVEGARQAAEASVVCMPGIGAKAWCSIQRAVYGGLAESSASKPGTGPMGPNCQNA